ncbi:hypothetical protein HDU98_010222 [Podochytrium sp. JEL0797]|nr:hypothetical protein HDU98_010222 [Podochytrium sp. JEL0797]
MQRRKNTQAVDAFADNDDAPRHFAQRNSASSDNNEGDNNAAIQDYDDDDSEKTRNKLTLMEEILLMGLKDAQGHLSFWNDNISYVIDERPTGEVLLDEALRMIKTDQQSIASWIDLMSGETWNLMSFNYQLKQVRERIAKGLVDKGVLRTEKRNFILFDMATHPISDYSVKEQLVAKTVDALLGRGAPARREVVAMCCAAYAANVLENALVGLNHVQREQAFTRVDEMLQGWAGMNEKAKAGGCDDVMAGVLSVYTKMDSLL